MSQIHIIFGGLGFIGVNLIRNLEKTSKKIYVVDKNIWNTSLLWIDECECEIEIYKEDITNFLSLKDLDVLWVKSDTYKMQLP